MSNKEVRYFKTKDGCIPRRLFKKLGDTYFYTIENDKFLIVDQPVPLEDVRVLPKHINNKLVELDKIISDLQKRKQELMENADGRKLSRYEIEELDFNKDFGVFNDEKW